MRSRSPISLRKILNAAVERIGGPDLPRIRKDRQSRLLACSLRGVKKPSVVALGFSASASPAMRCGRFWIARSGGPEQAELGQRGDAVVEADLLRDLAVNHLQDRRAGEAHLAAGRGRKAANQEVFEGRTGVGSPAFPLANDIVAFGDQIGGPPEVEVGKRGAKIGH